MEINDRFTIGDYVDRDGEVEIDVGDKDYGFSSITYINKSQALELIQHLSNLFSLEMVLKPED